MEMARRPDASFPESVATQKHHNHRHSTLPSGSFRTKQLLDQQHFLCDGSTVAKIVHVRSDDGIKEEDVLQKRPLLNSLGPGMGALADVLVPTIGV